MSHFTPRPIIRRIIRLTIRRTVQFEHTRTGAMFPNPIPLVLILLLTGMLTACGNGNLPEATMTAAPTGIVIPRASATPTDNGAPADTGEGSAATPEPGQTSAVQIEEFFNQSYGELLLRNPELVSELGLSEVFGVEDDGWADVSPAFEAETAALAQTQLDALHAWEVTILSPEEQVSYRVYEWYLQDIVESETYLLNSYPYNHLFGWPSAWADFMMNYHPLKTEGDVQGYITRLATFNLKAETMVAFMEAQQALGIRPPRQMLTYVLSQVEGYANQPAGEHILLTSFQERMAGSSTDSSVDESAFTEAQRTQFDADVEAAISNGVLVGYQHLAQTLENWLAETDTDLGLGTQPGGAEAYAFFLRHHTTTDMTAEEIHALGLEEVARITAEMETGFAALGISGETMADKIRLVAVASGFVQGQEAVVETYTQILDQVETDFSGYFDQWPETDMEVIAFSSPFAAGAFYTSPALDGTKPGQFFVNVGAGQYAFGMPTLAYHEGLPGHHYQIALQQEVEGLPYFRNGVNFTAYAEGWALYTEYLAWEAGLYKDDPYGNLGRLQGELFRAARLVVDTGIHARGWTRDEAITYLADVTGFQTQAATSEVDRYFAWPGQATAYKIGMLKILELRQRAMDALGAEFDIVAFHHLVVGNGAMPLEVLERVVDQWIEETKGN